LTAFVYRHAVSTNACLVWSHHRPGGLAASTYRSLGGVDCVLLLLVRSFRLEAILRHGQDKLEHCREEVLAIQETMSVLMIGCILDVWRRIRPTLIALHCNVHRMPLSRSRRMISATCRLLAQIYSTPLTTWKRGCPSTEAAGRAKLVGGHIAGKESSADVVVVGQAALQLGSSIEIVGIVRASARPQTIKKITEIPSY